MPCTVKKTFEVARATGNDLIVQVKDNQPTLLHRCEDIVATTPPVATDTTRTLGRNRQEDRTVTVFAPGSRLGDTEWGPLIVAVVRVERRTLIRNAATGLWTMRQEISFYVASVMLPAKTFAEAIRNHWAIENRNHWVRDVTLGEDASRIRVNPGIMARLRSLALNIARANGATNIAEALWNAALDPAVTLAYIGL
jgi:predicted transposase YbfD/YdcC